MAEMDSEVWVTRDFAADPPAVRTWWDPVEGEMGLDESQSCRWAIERVVSPLDDEASPFPRYSSGLGRYDPRGCRIGHPFPSQESVMYLLLASLYESSLSPPSDPFFSEELHSDLWFNSFEERRLKQDLNSAHQCLQVNCQHGICTSDPGCCECPTFY